MGSKPLIIRLAFYHGPGRLFDKLVRWFTRSKYSHVELCFTEDLAFSADAWQTKRTRFIKANFNPAHWDYRDFVVNLPQWQQMYDAAVVINNRPYDYLGILSFVTRSSRQDQDKWFCSEVACYLLQHAGFFRTLNPARTTPQMLFDGGLQ